MHLVGLSGACFVLWTLDPRYPGPPHLVSPPSLRRLSNFPLPAANLLRSGCLALARSHIQVSQLVGVRCSQAHEVWIQVCLVHSQREGEEVINILLSLDL